MMKRVRLTALCLLVATFSFSLARAMLTERVANVRESISPGVMISDMSLPGGLNAWRYELNDDGSNYTRRVNAHFQVEASSGLVRTRASFDYEDAMKRTWSVIVVARRVDKNAGSVAQMLLVSVLDENDSPPRFSRRKYYGIVKENEGIGTLVSGLSGAFVTDLDSPQNGADLLTFRVLSGNSRMSFVVRGRKDASGDLVFLEVLTTKRLDREEQREYDLVIETSDSQHTALCHVVISVADVNDNPPVFASSGYQVAISADIRPGTSVAHLSATDRDDGLNSEVYYSLRVASNSNFSINPYTGIVSTTRSLIEAAGQSVLTVEARDRQTGKQQISSTTLLTITVKEANYYSPQISVSFSLPVAADVGSVHESAPTGTAISTVTVTDRDKGVNGITTLSISSGNEDQTFKVTDNGNGQFVLELNRLLNREKIPQYTLQLMACDSGEPMKTTTVIITIQLLDDDDMTPQFKKNHYNVSIDESVLIGSQVALVTATDGDIGINAKLSYSIKSGNNPNWFSIDSATGQIRTISLLDAKENGSFQLVVIAQDQGAAKLSSSTTVTVHIRDSNNHSPVFSLLSYAAKVSESSEIGVVVIKMTATDGDVGNNGNVSYSIIYNNPQRPDPFVINSITGIVSTMSALDYESIPFYSLTIRASDYGTPYLRHSDVTLTVRVVNENDNVPRFSSLLYSPLVASTAAAGTIVTHLTAVDDDLDNLTFTLTSGDQTKFNVTHDGYVILLTSLGTQLPSYVLKVSVSDGKYNSTARIIITVYDSTLRVPVFQSPSGYSLSVSEVASIGHIVGRVQAFSTDNLSVIYNIADGNHDGVFNVDQAGDIVLHRRVDYEKQKLYSLTVTAVDKSGSVQRTGVASVSVQVIGVNDERPHFSEDLKKEVIISQRVTKGSHVATMRASDADNDRLTYSVHGSSEVVSHFAMKDDHSGIVVTKKTFLDNDPPLVFPEIKIKVSDGLHSMYYSFRVVIKDSNNQYPKFNSSIVEFNVSEDAAVGLVIGSIVAQDGDLEYNAMLRYLITAGDSGSQFVIDPITGILSVQSTLDHEIIPHYNMTVTVGDLGLPHLTSTSLIIIHIVNVNDLPPVFASTHYVVSISESTPVGQNILTVNAIDPDGCSVSYEMGSDIRGRFIVEQMSGVLRVAKTLDRESTPNFQFYVRAFDCAPSLVSLVRVQVQLVDENDEPPQFLLPQYDLTVRQDLPVGSAAVTLYAQDADEGSNSIVKYQMRTGDVTTWKVDDITGSVILLQSLKKKEQFRLEVIAANIVSPYQIATTTVKINVSETNRNYNSPIFPGFISVGEVHENAVMSTSVMTVTATDKDDDENSDILYTVRGGSGVGMFAINETSGEITVISRVDHEKSSYYTLLIHAHDQGIIPLTAETEIVIHVIDTNDNSPVADVDVIRSLAYSCAGSGGFVAAVYGSDVDSGYGGHVSYAITSGNILRRFSIDSVTGIVTSLSGIDSDGLSQYNLRITLSDNGTVPLSSTAVVTIRVTDCSDQKPQFVGLPYVSQVPENRNNLYVLQVVAHNNDSSGSIMYTLSDTFDGLFSMNSLTGVISCQPLDYEAKQQYHLAVTASSGSNTVSTNVTVFVTNERDKPVFTNLPTTIYVQELSSIDRVIMSVSAIDPDGLLHTNISYFIVSADDDILSTFSIDSTSGDISQNGSLDYERRNQYRVYVEAKYNNSCLFSWSYLTIIVLDEDDNLPVFDQSPFYYIMVPSFSTINTTLITIHAVDYDTGTNAAVEYAIPPSDQSHFSIDRLTGTLQMKQPVVGLTTTLTVIARNPANIARQTNVTVILSAVMPSKSTPTFSTPKVVTLSVRESLSINTVVARATAMSSRSATVEYEIAGGNVDGAWMVDSMKGTIAIAKKLVYEQLNRYNLVIRAIIRQTPPQTDEKTFVISILPVNDHKPHFTQPNPLTVFVEEDQPAGVFVTRATASDLDAGRYGQIRYSLAGSSVFSVDAVTGIVTTTASLDYEAQSSYVLYVQARDLGLPALMADVELKLIVNVVDLLDDQPVFHQVYSAMIPENSPVGTTLMKVFAVDINKRHVRYSLTSLDSAEVFQVNPLSGDVIVASHLDRENMSSFELSITGSNGLTESVTIMSVHVQDVNDNAPTFTQSLYSVFVEENRTYRQQWYFLSAQDNDSGINGTVIYSMVTSSSVDLQFTSNGSITVTTALDRERCPSEHFIAAASDGGVPPLCGYAKVEVSVTDVNDHTPIFTSGIYEASVFEDAALGTTVAHVVATDLDAGEYGKVRYQIISGNLGSVFEIDSVSGAVRLKANLDYEEKPTYSLTVKAADGGQPEKMSTTKLFVIVVDVADAVPRFSQSVYPAIVDEGSMAGTFVIHVVVTTIHSVVYSLVETSDAKKFSVNSNTGVVTTAALLDREAQDSFKLTVNVTDVYNQWNSANILITVTDLNDNAPEFQQELYATTVPDDAPLGLEVLTVFAVDHDVGSNGKVSYKYVISSPFFSLDQKTGNLTINRLLTGMGGESFRVVITANDHGDPSFSALQQATVYVTVTVPHYPRFDKTLYNVSIVVPVDVDVVTVSATDVDINETLTYSIISGDSQHHFSIDTLTGQIVVRQHVGISSFYKLKVAVSDRVHVNYTVVLVYISSLFEFSQSNYRVSVSEGAPVGTVILNCSLLTTARDIVFSLSTPFTEFMVRQNASLFIADHLDRETRPFYRLIVTATSLDPPRVASTEVNVTVSDINDNVPQFVGQQPFKGYFREGQPAGTTIYQLFGHDDDEEGVNAEIFFQPVGVYPGLPFSVLSGGQIIVSQNLDSGTHRSYQIEIRCFDSGKPRLSSTVWVSLSKLFSSGVSPLFEHSSYRLNASEDLPVGSTLSFIRAAATVGLTVTYSVKAGGDKFTVDANGALIVSKSLDFESRQQHLLTVEGTDGVHSSDVTITINVVDVNDNIPQFPLGDNLFFSVNEGHSAKSFLLNVPATDVDSGLNSLLFYQLESKYNEVFWINSSTGDLFLNHPLDYERVPEYLFKIWVRDSGQPPLYTTVTAHITVININDEKPYFDGGNIQLQVSDKTQRGSVIGQVLAIDKDNLGPLLYSFHHGNDNGVFRIGRNTGALVLEKERQNGFYRLNVSVTDGLFTAYSQVVVAVGDVNEHIPQFMPGTCSGSVDEGSANGTYVKTLSVSDADLGTNGVVTFQVLGNSKLHVDQTTGEVFTSASSRDLYRPNNCNPCFVSAQVLAADGGGNTAYCRLDVTLNDVNNNAPLFTTSVYNVAVEDNKLNGMLVLTVSADDADEGTNSQIMYSIIGNSTSARMFEIQSDGSIWLVGQLNAKIRSSYQFKVQATDKGNPPLSSTADVIVSVLDSISHPPAFSQSKYNATVYENVSKGTVVITVNAMSQDGRVYYTAPVGNSIRTNSPRTFYMDMLTGQLKTKQNLDYETNSEYLIVVQAENAIATVYSTVLIHVIDINDNAPTFPVVRYRFSLHENRSVGTTVGRTLATDSDSGQNGLVIHEIVEPFAKALFSIDSKGGWITTQVVFDYEHMAHNTAIFVVVATDGGSPPKSGNALVEVKVIDVNDNAPSFSHDVYSLTVREDAPPGFRVSAGISVTDVDELAILTYTVSSGNDSDMFAVVADTGMLQIQGMLDYETTTSYNLKLTVSDGLHRATTSVIVDLLDVNDVTPVFTSSYYFVSVYENVTIGSAVILVTANDRDATPDVVTYSLQGSGQASKLVIDANSGLVTTSGTLDRETSERNVFVLLAVDQVGHVGHSQLELILIDVNDESPVFEDGPYIAHVKENMPSGTTVGRFTADDRDKGENHLITYSFIANPGNYFAIDSVTAVIVTVSAIDREVTSQLTVTIKAVDAGNPRLTGQTNVTIEVTDENDNSPYFASRDMLVRVFEDAAIGWRLIQLSAIDRDSGPNSQLTYTITAGNSQSMFTVEANTGIVRLSGLLDWQSTSWYRLTIEVCDSGFPVRQDIGTLTIIVLDANDHTPQFAQVTYHVTVQESALIHTELLVVNATDDDEGTNGQISFNLMNGDPTNRFQLSHDGRLEIVDHLDYELVKVHNLTIAATDAGYQRQRTATAKVQIFVTDVNDNKPVFEHLMYVANIKENSKAVTSLLQVSAFDQDSGSNGQIVRYEIIEGNNAKHFTMNTFSGVIEAGSHLDREMFSKYTLTVVAVDGGSTPLSGSTTIDVTVLDVNDNPSKGGERSIYVNAYKGQFAAGVIGTVNAGDPDSSDVFSCHHISSTAPDMVTINKTNCDVVLLTSNPQDGLTVKLTATANDGSHPDVTVSVNTVFRYFNNEDIEHSLSLEISVTRIQLLDHGIERLQNALAEIFSVDSRHVYIYSIQESVLRPKSASIVTFSVKQKGENYMSMDRLIANVSVNRMQVNELSGVVILSIPFTLCAHEPCRHRSQCINRVTALDQLYRVHSTSVSFISLSFERDYQCKCEPGLTGRRCETNIDDCFFSPCHNGGTCIDELQGYSCSCPFGTSGNNCQVASHSHTNSVCHNGGTYSTRAGGYECLCHNAYFGHNCQFSVFSTVNSCSSSPCLNNGVCSAGPTGYTCSCQLGFTGRMCEQSTFLTLPCTSNPCLHGGTCSSKGESFHCDCPEGFIGDTCSWNINPCDLLPCLNGGTCYHGQFSMFACDCMSGFSGRRCEKAPQPCHSNPCRNAGVCNDDGLSDDYNCDCPVSYYGKNCQYAVHPPDYCSSSPCQNGATCTTGRDTFTCSCAVGFNGKTCSSIDTSTDMCANNPCLHGSTCVASHVSYSCQCSAGFYGDACEHKYNVCKVEMCHNGGTCQPGINAFTCLCPEGVAGRFCEVLCPSGKTGASCDQLIDACHHVGVAYCHNGGTCESRDGKALCHCAAGFTGERCSDEQSCTSSPCKHNGTCSPKSTGGYECSCSVEYEGPNCEATAASFQSRAFRAFKSASIAAYGSLRLDFITVTSRGLLLYNSQWQNGIAVDFIVIEIVNGHIEMAVDLGDKTEKLVVSDVTVSDGQWHSVEISHTGQEFSLSVDSCDARNYMCQATGVVRGKMEYLNLGLPMYVGGVHPNSQHSLLSASDFQGCIRNVYVGEWLLDMADFLLENGTEEGCRHTSGCQSGPCLNGGTCREIYDGFECLCPPGSVGVHCHKDAEAVTFSGNNFIRYSFDSRPIRDTSEMRESYQESFSFLIRPRLPTGVLMKMYNTNRTEFATLELIAGNMLYSFDVGSGHREVGVNISLTDDRYHYIHILRVGQSAHLTVDGTASHFAGSSNDEQILEFDANSVHIGGSPDDVGFSGCLKDPRYKDLSLPLQGSNVVARAEPIGGVQQSCDCPNLCESGQCEEEGKECVQEFVDRCFSFQCVDFTCDLCSEAALCDVQQQLCICPPDYIADECEVRLSHSRNIDIDHTEGLAMAGIVMFLIIVVIILVVVRQMHQRKRKQVHNEVAGVSNPINNATLVTTRRFSGFQTVIPYKDEGGGESASNQCSSDSVSDLERIRHVSALSGNSGTKLMVRCQSPEVSSSSSVLERKRKLEESEERTTDNSVLSLYNVKTVDIRAHDSPASSISTSIAKHTSSAGDVFTDLEARLAEADKQIETTFNYDKPIEYDYEGNCSNATSLSSICSHDHKLENESLSFEFLHGLNPSFKSVTDIYSGCEIPNDEN